MSVLILSDIHLKTRDQFDLENGIVSDRSIYKLKRLKELVDKVKPDMIIFGGDEFDSRSPSEPLRYAFFKVLDSLNIPCYIISGNHSQEHGFSAGTSEAYLSDIINIIQPRKFLSLSEFTLVGYCRDKDEFLRLCNENPNEFLVTHGDIPNENLPFKHCFFGHVHKNYSVGNKHSIGALFTDSFGEENEKCFYCVIDDEGFEFKEFPDRPIKTFTELTDFEDGEYLAVRYKLKGKAKDFLTLDQDRIKKSYKKTNVFFDVELTEEELVFDNSISIEDLAKDFIQEKSLTEKELKFGKIIMKESEDGNAK